MSEMSGIEKKIKEENDMAGITKEELMEMIKNQVEDTGGHIVTGKQIGRAHV